MKLVEESIWKLKVDGKPAITELTKLEDQLEQVKLKQKDLKRGTTEWTESKKEVKALEDEIKKVRETMGLAGMTVKQLEKYQKQLNAEWKDSVEGTDKYIKKTAELNEVNARLKKIKGDVQVVSDEVKKSQGVWSGMKEWITGALSAFTIVNLLDSIANFTREGMRMAVTYTDAFADIQKTTGMTAQEVEKLNAELQKIDTRTAQESLLEIAKVGGAIGIAQEQMLGFVEATDKAVVALGDEFTGGAEEVAKVMGTLSKIFKETKELEAGDAINQIGSAINELGAAGTATGPVVADFATRIGQLGNLAPQISQTLGLGAAFQELGLSAEISAGGLSNILLTASKSTELFAQHLGMTDQAFKDMIRSSPNEVILQLAASFRGMPIDEVVKRMDTLGIKSQEATKVMSLLSNQTEVVREKQELANTAMQEGTSLTNEFNIKNTNAAAELAKATKALDAQRLALGQALLPALTNVITGFVSFIKVIGAVPAFVRENKEMIIALGVAIVSFNASLIAATASSLAHAAAEKARLVWTQSATVAQWAMNTALVSNPIGAVVALIAILVGGFITLYKNSESVRGIINGVWAALKTGIDVIVEVAGKVADGFSQLIDKMPFLTRAFEFVGEVAGTVFDAMGDALSWVGDKISVVIDFYASLYAKIFDVGQSIGNAMRPGFEFIIGGFEFVRTKINEFFSFVGEGVSKVTGFLKSITPDGFIEAGKTFFDAGKRIGKSFQDAFQSEQEAGQQKQTASTKKHLDEKANASKKTDTEIANAQTTIHDQTLAKKDNASQAHRTKQAEADKRAAEKAAEEKVKAEAAAQKAIEDAQIKAIADQETREIAQLRLSYSRTLQQIADSKASQTTKAAWEKALAEQLERDIAAVEKTHREKKIDEERKRVEEINKLEAQQRTDRQTREYDTTRQILQSQLANERISIAERRTLKLELIELERQREIQRIEEVAAKERQKAFETSEALKKLAGDDAEARKQIDADYAATSKAIDDKLLADKAAANQQHQNNKRDVEQKSLEERKANQEGFFNALKGLMDGDYTAFTTFIANKFSNEKAMNDERLQNWTAKAGEILAVVGQSVQLLQKLNQKYLEDQINRNAKERDDKIKKLQQQYSKNLIDKETLEKGMAQINKEADDRDKAIKLKAWKRDQAAQIAMAIINGAMAALKSLATMGFPLGLIGVAASAAMTGVQIALIRRQQPPTFGRGGKLRNAGVPDGPAHGSRYGESGISLVRRDTREEVGEMEGGEPIMILSKNTYRNNGPVIDKLLHSSLHRNGAPIYAQDGGVFNSDGGTYGGLLYGKMYNNGFGTTYDDGSGDYNDNNSNTGATDPNYDAEFRAPTPEPSSDEYSSSDAAYTTELTQGEIQKSQQLMERIGKNTADTAMNTLGTQNATDAVANHLLDAIRVLESINAAANRTADNAADAARASWAAADASNRAADAVAMSSRNDL